MLRQQARLLGHLQDQQVPQPPPTPPFFAFPMLPALNCMCIQGLTMNVAFPVQSLRDPASAVGTLASALLPLHCASALLPLHFCLCTVPQHSCLCTLASALLPQHSCLSTVSLHSCLCTLASALLPLHSALCLCGLHHQSAPACFCNCKQDAVIVQVEHYCAAAC